MEKEEAETVASQEKADHKLKERLGKDNIDMNYNGENQDITEETLFWTEEVESELNRWDDEKFKLEEVIAKLMFQLFQRLLQLKNCLVHAHGQTSRPSRVADKCMRLREARIGEDRVLDTVEESLIREMENVRLWQMRLKTAIEQVR